MEVFESRTFPLRIHQAINDLKNDQKICDFTIAAGTKEWKVHKIIVAAASDYFRSMFVHNSKEDQENQVKLNDLKEEAVEAVLEFCYTSKVLISTENVQDLLVAASILQIQELLNLCEEFIRKRIDTANCLGVLTVADRCNMPHLFHLAFEYCLDRFEDIVDEKEFYDLDESLLTKIISDDKLNVKSEESAFNAVIRWYSADRALRLERLDELLNHVRFALIDPVRLIDLKASIADKYSTSCIKFMVEGLESIILVQSGAERPQFQGARFSKRCPLRRKQRIYAVGGWTDDLRPVCSLEVYHPYKNKWKSLKPMTTPRCGAGTTFVGEILYVIGGHDGTSDLKSVERYDITTGLWHNDVAEMPTQRTSVGVVYLNGHIYAIGGQHEIGASAEVERYDPKSNKWIKCRSMSEKRIGAGVTVLGGKIYVVGGFNSWSVLKTVECFDPVTNEWDFVEPLSTSRKHLGCTACGGLIYAVGGRSAAGELDTAEQYDPTTNTWEVIPCMNEKRSGLGLVNLDGEIIAAGGHNGDLRLDLVESYNPDTRRWTIKQPMLDRRLGGGLAVYSQLNRSS